MVGAASFLGLWVILSLTDTAVSMFSKCRVASFRVVGSFSSACDIQFGYTTAPPDWIDQLQVVESFRNATDGQLDAFAKDACRCRMLRVHRHCPNDLFELIKGVAWRCFPGARDAVRKGIEDTVMAKGQPSSEGEEVGGRVYQIGGEGSGDWDQRSTDSLQTENKGEETTEEGQGTEEMSTTAPDVRSTAAVEATVITNREDESIDTTSVDSISLEETGKDSLELISEDSFVAVTEASTALEGMNKGSAEENFESIPENSAGAGIQDSTERPDGGNTGENKKGKNATDTGIGEVEDEYYDEDSMEDLELEGSAGGEAP